MELVLEELRGGTMRVMLQGEQFFFEDSVSMFDSIETSDANH